MPHDNQYGTLPVPGSDDTSDEENHPFSKKKNEDRGSMANQKWRLRATKMTKFLSYPIVFLIVLGGNVIAKGTVLFMTSQLRGDRRISYCNRLLHRNMTFVTTVPEIEKAAWIWCIIFAFAAPEFLTFIRSLVICLLRSSKIPKPQHFLLATVMQTFHVIGLALMFLSILPDLNVVRGAMLTSCVCFVPGLLGLLSRNKKRDGSKLLIFALLDIIALTAQMAAIIFWPLQDTSKTSLWIIPAALIMVSCGWWENYVSENSSFSCIKSLGRIREKMRSSNNFTGMILPLLKIAVFILSTVLILNVKWDTDPTYLFEIFTRAFASQNITVIEIQPINGRGTVPDFASILPDGIEAMIITDSMIPIYFLVIQISSAYLAYVSGKFACKTLIQGFSYAVPINLTVSILTSILVAVSHLRNKDPCLFHGILPDNLFFNSPPPFSSFGDFISAENIWMIIIMSGSQAWITIHINTPKCERPESTENLFVAPFYNGLLIDQSMGLNRRRDDGRAEDSKRRQLNREGENGVDEPMREGPPSTNILESDIVTKLYACATMWHENKGEMKACLKSILRLDRNQCARKSSQKWLNIVGRDHYELESHIFFDDAFKKTKHNKKEVEVNERVKQFVKLLDDTTFRETGIMIKPMKKYPTPYGGRLVWTLPGNTQLYLHLKDSSKIRQKKRWSQVMYMQYLLRYHIKELVISKERKKAIAENTFLLALDGDIVFHPSAVKLLIDLMRKDKNLGAACGRIHPLGSGPMVWYQMFEYAIGHWLQKSTEHMIGCVLCSPGCFSLFRAKALLKSNVMDTYMTKPTEARHYVQYDQGEDRWLCTLLLKRGYRVEYSAASDAYTHAPEGFNEFFKQRRRWLPSTMANIMDILEDYRHIVDKNKHISHLYMLYELLLTAGTILGPGNIFLMLVGAFGTAFHIGIWHSFYYNLIPVLIFVVICFTCNTKNQLFIAAVISMMYGLVMIAVIVGIFLQIFEDTWLAPSSIFLILVIGQILITGILHPQEIGCLPHGIMYFLTIPSMYMLLVIYSIANLNDVSWGTRVEDDESNGALKKLKNKKMKKQKKKHEESNQNVDDQRSLFNLNRNDQGFIEFSLSGLFKCVCCLLAVTKPLDNSSEKMESPVDPEEQVSGPQHPFSAGASESKKCPERPAGESDSETSVSQNAEDNRDRAFLVNPYWLEDDDLKRGEVDFLTTREERFWEDIIEKHLHPIQQTEDEEKKVATNLRDLRDRTFITFFMINALFVSMVFLMQLNQDLVHIEWPLNSRTRIFYDQSSLEVHIEKNYLKLEPIGLVFVVFFGLILVIQFTAMLFHRFSTFTHILATTSLQGWGYCWKKPNHLLQKSFLLEVSEEIVEELERYAQIDMDQRSNLNNPLNQTLDEVFRQRIFSMSEGSGLPRHVSTRRSTMIFQALQGNELIATQRRLSQSQGDRSNNSQENNGNMSPGQTTPSITTSLNPIREVTENHSGAVNFAFEIDESLS